MNALSAVSSWIADTTVVGRMIFGARAGQGLGREIYSQLPSEMTQAPGNGLAAYKQASYFLALAVRRADTMDETGPSDALLNALDEFVADASVLEEQVNFVCRWGGVMCPGGAPAILQRVIDAIESSGLNIDDRSRIVSILKSNRRSAQINQAMPYVALVGIGAIAGTWFMYRKRA